MLDSKLIDLIDQSTNQPINQASTNISIEQQQQQQLFRSQNKVSVVYTATLLGIRKPPSFSGCYIVLCMYSIYTLFIVYHMKS